MGDQTKKVMRSLHALFILKSCGVQKSLHRLIKDTHLVLLSHFQMQCELTNILSLRLILRQPSPMWKEYRLDDIVCYKTSIGASSDVVLPSWITEGKKPVVHQKLKVCSFCQSLLSLMMPSHDEHLLPV